MQLNLCLTIGLFCMAVILVPSTHGLCGSCTNANVACVNETSFYNCHKGTPDDSQAFNCPNNKICTVFSEVCMERSPGAEPDCSISDSCGVCKEGQMFVCTSRTTFVQCNGSVSTGVRGKCPAGLLCQTSAGGDMCVDECEMHNKKLDCDSDVEIII